MKKQLLKKLSAFIVTAMMFSASANAQIVYTDVNPDSTLYVSGSGLQGTKHYNLDLNNDGNTDFILTALHNTILSGTTSSVSVSPLNGNAVKDTLVNSDNVSIPLQFNAVIDSNLLFQQSWQTSGGHSLFRISNSGNIGLWNGLSDYYLGLGLLLSGQTYYGWVRLRVNVQNLYASITVRDYAYNTIPNQPINAGETGTTGIIENSFASSINLFPNPAADHFTIALSNTNEKVEVTIADITGKIIPIVPIPIAIGTIGIGNSTIASDSGSYGEQKLEVNTEDFKEGIYIVQIQSAGFIETRKIIISK